MLKKADNVTCHDKCIRTTLTDTISLEYLHSLITKEDILSEMRKWQI